MQKKYLYFQPRYVEKFKCDGSKCNARCCRGWNVFIDEKTYEQYSQIKPESESAEILSHMTFNDERKEHLVKMHDNGDCPFLNEKKLCRLQLKYGEEFLSVTCSTFPRRSLNFGKFFERSLGLTCPVAAEMILFNEEPMQFEFVKVSEKVHSNGCKIGIAPVNTTEGFAEHMLEIQIAMISILQERTLTIDQRLIVLGFFLDKFDEIITNKNSESSDKFDALKKLIAAYESKKFLAEQVPHMLATIQFDAKKFVELLLELLETLYGGTKLGSDRKFLVMVAKTLGIVPDAHGQVSAVAIAENYVRLADKLKDFFARRSSFLENYLVNELFLNCYPWRHEKSIAKNFGVFVASYKIFELLMFAAEQQNFKTKEDLLTLTNWFVSSADHTNAFIKKILERASDDIFLTFETLLQP
ncbi:MAG: flagellin lysine-N-methylase [Selenomonadaceae bacterium]|nr:flagellin lysine-N-methylase [Selenomonadaceae bacterium]